MAVKVDFEKTGRVETNQQATQTTKSTSEKKPQNSNVFKVLLSELKLKENSEAVNSLRNRPASSDLRELKFKENSEAVSSLRNRPASSQLVKHDHHSPSKNPGVARGLHSENVNNLAASALIAMASISSGLNRIGGICSGAAGLGRFGGTSSIGGVCGSTPEVGTMLCPGQEIGVLSAHFESCEKGPGAIGYDYNGGTSYGTYQISSRAGTMKRFVDYLSERAPDLANKLKAAGPANTGNTFGKMPEVWKKVATEDPVRFSKLQYDFIEKSHYLPAVQEISDRTGLDISKAPRALQEVLWSTAVQHGPNGAAKIFNKAIKHSEAKNGGVKMAQLIGSVYAMRAGQFGSSLPNVRAAVRSRFREEGRMALAMLSDPFLSSEGLRA
ncbi:MAG: hypothetical protein ABSG35_13955 [Syntrophobacteraceae bacterium]|jgi:hypothetical protein